ncbi:MAG TPA: hypothetical protein VKV26_12740 [Dehalococcoidia bacterium]|nr:hypothetical protein [Dehalococcoidia bacterium]
MADAPEGEIAGIVTRAAEVRRTCVFCGIVARQAPAHTLRRDAHTLAFLDLDQRDPARRWPRSART